MVMHRTVRWRDVVVALVIGIALGFVIEGPVLNGQARKAVMPDAAAMEALVAKDAIRDQIYNYCRGLDRMDKALALSVWHPDATVITGNNMNATMSGPQWIDAAWKAHENIHSHTHQMTNILIKLDGDKATSETYFNTSLHAEPATGNTTSLIRGRYLDRWSKRNGRWAMDHRQILVDFTTSSPGPNATGLGRRDTTDPSYRFF